MKEYGREVQTMIEYCMQLDDRQERQRCAARIVKTMEQMHPGIKQQPDYKHKLWDHLAIMSGFQIDIDYPCDITKAEAMRAKPEPVPYSQQRMPVRHYGSLVFKTLAHLKEMPAGKDRDVLAERVANQMKRDLVLYGNGMPDDERVLSDLARFTDGKIQLDPNRFHFAPVVIEEKKSGKKKKK